MTELVFILDRSGSMSGLEEDTIGGLNSMLRQQKQDYCDALVSTVMFDSSCRIIHDRLPLKQVPPMTEQDYMPRGSTALLDAVGSTIQHISNIHKYARKEDIPKKTLFVITTDGLENASRQYSYAQVRQMVRRQEETHGWEFLFLGAHIDAEAEAERFGIRAEHAVNYHSDKEGTALNYEVISDAVKCVRASEPLCANWKARIDQDFQSR